MTFAQNEVQRDETVACVTCIWCKPRDWLSRDAQILKLDTFYGLCLGIGLHVGVQTLPLLRMHPTKRDTLEATVQT